MVEARNALDSYPDESFAENLRIPGLLAIDMSGFSAGNSSTARQLVQHVAVQVRRDLERLFVMRAESGHHSVLVVDGNADEVNQFLGTRLLQAHCERIVQVGD